MASTKGSLLAACLLVVATVGGCVSESKKLTVHMYQLRGQGDQDFINNVLAQEQAQRGVISKTEVSKDHVATVTTTERAHLQLRRELNVRVSDQWPYNWRTDDF